MHIRDVKDNMVELTEQFAQTHAKDEKIISILQLIYLNFVDMGGLYMQTGQDSV